MATTYLVLGAMLSFSHIILFHYHDIPVKFRYSHPHLTGEETEGERG